MTEKLARRGATVRADYATDHLTHVLVGDVASREVVTRRAEHTLEGVRGWRASGAAGASHQGFPVVATGTEDRSSAS